MLGASALLVAILVPLLGLEILLRLLPGAYDGSRMLPVNEENPIFRFEPDREFTWSRDWNFSIVNRVKINNAGFVSDFDYEMNTSGPLLAVIGDSYVEALMIPFRRTCAGRLAGMLAPAARVYSFGTSGSALSQYLAYAEYVRDTFRADGLVVNVVGNDYDESLKKYSAVPGHHYFAEKDDGRAALLRIDREVSFLYELARSSALARYLVNNLRAQESVHAVRRWITGRNNLEVFVGNTSASTHPTRIADSRRAVDAFLDRLPEFSGLPPERILFVVDGMRPHLYDEKELKVAEGSFVGVMRRYLMANAGRQGYQVIDMQPVFVEHYGRFRRKFEWPHDGHWNEAGHERCFEAVAGSRLLTGKTSRFRPEDAAGEEEAG